MRRAQAASGPSVRVDGNSWLSSHRIATATDARLKSCRHAGYLPLQDSLNAFPLSTVIIEQCYPLIYKSIAGLSMYFFFIHLDLTCL